MSNVRRRRSVWASKVISGAAAVTALALTRTTTGLMFGDNFERSDRDLDGDNGWSAQGAANAWKIVDNKAHKQSLPDDDHLHRVVADSVGDITYHADLDAGIDGVIHGPFVRGKMADPSDPTYYLVQFSANGNQVALWERLDGSFNLRFNITGITITMPGNHPSRIVVRASGADDIVDALLDTGSGLVSRSTWTDTTPQRTGYDVIGARSSVGGDNGEDHDNLFVAGVDVVINLAPTGSVATLAGGAEVAESSGTITFDSDVIVFGTAGAELILLDASGGATLDTVADAYPGDVFDYA